MHVQALSKKAFFSKYPRCILLSASYEQVNHWPRAVNEADKSYRLQRVCSLCTAMSKSPAATGKNFSRVKNQNKKQQVNRVFCFLYNRNSKVQQRSRYVTMTKCCVRSAQTAFKSRFCRVSAGSSNLNVTMRKHKRKENVQANHSTFHQGCTCSWGHLSLPL